MKCTWVKVIVFKVVSGSSVTHTHAHTHTHTHTHTYTVQTSYNLNDARVSYAFRTRVQFVSFLLVASHACVSVIDTQVHARTIFAHVNDKVDYWVSCVRKLSAIAMTHPHVAYCAFTHGLVGKWT